MNRQISVRLVVLFYAFLYVSRREGGYEVTFIGQFAQGVVFLSFTLVRLFSHRAHRVHGGFWHTFRAHRTPSAYREHRAFQLKVGVG